MLIIGNICILFEEFYMSQFIQISDHIMDYRATHRSVLKGSLSHISHPNLSSSLIKGQQNQNYYREKVSLRIRDQQKHAGIAHLLSLETNYQRLKHKLHNYARSKSFKLQNAFEKVNVAQNRKQMQRSQKRISRISMGLKEDDKTIFIDRKYNRQLAIKTATVSQMEEIRTKKEQIRRAMSCHQANPLVDQLNRELYSNSVLNKPEETNNPVVSRVNKSRLQKRQRVFDFNIRSSVLTKAKSHVYNRLLNNFTLQIEGVT